MPTVKYFLETTSSPDVVGIKPFLPELWADEIGKQFAAKIDADIMNTFYGLPRPLSVEDSYDGESYAEAIAWALTLGIDVTIPRPDVGKKQKILLSVRHAPHSIHEHAFKKCSPAELIDRLRAFATEIANA